MKLPVKSMCCLGTALATVSVTTSCQAQYDGNFPSIPASTAAVSEIAAPAAAADGTTAAEPNGVLSGTADVFYRVYSAEAGKAGSPDAFDVWENALNWAVSHRKPEAGFYISCRSRSDSEPDALPEESIPEPSVPCFRVYAVTGNNAEFKGSFVQYSSALDFIKTVQQQNPYAGIFMPYHKGTADPQ